MRDVNAVQVKKVKPHVLLGLSAVGGLFNEEVRSPILSFFQICALFIPNSSIEINYSTLNQILIICWHTNQVLKAMRDSDSSKPAIFAMSNPTNNGW